MSQPPTSQSTTDPKTLPTIEGLQFIMRHVTDIAAARHFYVQTLGFTIIDDGEHFFQLAPQQGSGASLGIGRATADTTGDELWWYVPDADALHASLAERGITILNPPHDMPFGRTFAIADPDNQAVHFLQLRQA